MLFFIFSVTANISIDSSSDVIAQVNTQEVPRKKKLYNTQDDQTEVVEIPDAHHERGRRRKQSESHKKPPKSPRPRNKRAHSSNDENEPPAVPQRKRKNSRDQDTETKPIEPKPNERVTRNRARTNYAEDKNHLLEDISEEQQLQSALRLSMKTYKKENPNDKSVQNGEAAVVDEVPDVDKEMELFAMDTMSRGELKVKMEDYLCLARNEYLSDVNIDFFIQYIYNFKMTEEQRNRTYIFGTHFYSLYAISCEFSGWKNDENAGKNAAQKRYMRVNGIVGDVNLFEKDFLIIPLMENNHWFLAVVCYPGLEGAYTVNGVKLPEDDIRRNNSTKPAPPVLKASIILIFDSIAGSTGRKTSAINHIRNFLRSEYEAKYSNSEDVKIGELLGHAPRVSTKTKFEYFFLHFCKNNYIFQCPLQSNNVDCGCFLLEFIERFFVTSPIENIRPPLVLSQWFDPSEVGATKRREIASSFETLMGESQVILPEIKFAPDPPAHPTVNLVEDDIIASSNNNDNNKAENKEYNNNNFNCVDSNKDDDAAVRHQISEISLAISQEDESIRAISDNINQLIQNMTENSELNVENDSIKLKQDMLMALLDETEVLTDVEQKSESEISNKEQIETKIDERDETLASEEMAVTFEEEKSLHEANIARTEAPGFIISAPFSLIDKQKESLETPEMETSESTLAPDTVIIEDSSEVESEIGNSTQHALSTSNLNEDEGLDESRLNDFSVASRDESKSKVNQTCVDEQESILLSD